MFHLLFLSMAAVIILLSVLMRSQGDREVFLPGFSSALPDTCTSRRLLGVDCPGCGMTRAFISISHGQFVRAWNFNPASYAVYLFVAIQIPWHAIQIWRLWSNRKPIEWEHIYLVPISVVVIMTVVWILKLTPWL